MDGPITALQTLGCDWFLHRFPEVNFLKLTDNNQIFRNDFTCIDYNLCKISSQIIECKIFDPYDFLEMNGLLLFYSDSRFQINFLYLTTEGLWRTYRLKDVETRLFL